MPPALGRGFTGDETSPDRMFVVILSDRLWKRRFGGDPAIVGKSILVEGAPYKVLGVMPPEFGFPTRDAQLWIPINMPPSRSGALWGNGGFRFVGRLRSGVTPAQAQQELRALYAQIRHENPVWDPGPTYGTTSTVTALQQQMVGSARPMLFLLLGVVGVVLLIACANVANLLLVRAAARGKEVAVRTALGGGRARLMRQFITESVVLTSLGGVCGVAVAWLGIHELMAALPSDIPRIAQVGIDARVLGFTSAIVIATGFVFGLLPALRARPDVQSTLRDGRRTSSGKSHRKLAALLVAGEIAAAVLLVIAASLLIRSAVALQRVDPGLRVSSIVTARLTPPRGRYTEPKSLVPLYDQVLARLEAMPGVQSAGAAAYLPLGSGISTSIALRIEGQFDDVRRNLPMIDHYQIVTPQFLSTMSIPIITGRAFTNTDRTGAPEVAVISESFAKHYWPNGDAVGKRIGYPWPSDWITIVGVVKDVRSDSLISTQNETLYRPLAQAPTLNMSIFIRTTSDPGVLAPSIRRAVAGVDPGVPVSDVQSMHAVVERSSARQRFTTLLLSLFAGLALLLGMVGIYGVMSYAVAQRTREIGVRMALGASPSDARRMVLKEGLSLAGAGIVVGLMAAAASTRALSGLLYGVTTTDPLTFVVVPAGVVVIVLLASYLPARRATRVDPTTALRAD
jgi:putative ABC transport system permease protein